MLRRKLCHKNRIVTRLLNRLTGALNGHDGNWLFRLPRHERAGYGGHGLLATGPALQGRLLRLGHLRQKRFGGAIRLVR
jgi:hypothetical protein